MKKILAILLLTLVPFAAGAQDARQRTAATIVADGLNQLPAQNPKAFDAVMQELAATGAEGIRMMAGMLVPAAEGKNAAVEYALNGDTERFLSTGMHTLSIAGALAVGVLVVSSLMRMYTALCRRRRI